MKILKSYNLLCLNNHQVLLLTEKSIDISKKALDQLWLLQLLCLRILLHRIIQNFFQQCSNPCQVLFHALTLLASLVYMIFIFHTVILSGLVAQTFIQYIYDTKQPIFEVDRVATDFPWENNVNEWPSLMKKIKENLGVNKLVAMGIHLMNCLFIQPVSISVEQIPTSFEMMWQITFFLLVSDYFDYWTHRALHHPLIYPYCHKKHHEVTKPFGYAASYADTIEMIILGFITGHIPVFLIHDKIHIGTYCFWLMLRSMETVDVHCGYDFSWSPFRLLPFSMQTDKHHFHHTQNLGIYTSFFYFWDILGESDTYYWQYKEKQKLGLVR